MLEEKGFAGRVSTIPRRPDSGRAALSHDQYRLWLTEQVEPGTALYNDCVAVRLRGGPLDVAVFDRALQEVVRRHEILRTTFEETGRGPIQVIHPGMQLPLQQEDLRGRPADERDRRLQRILEELQAPFDLTVLPLLRATLVRVSDDEHVFAVCTHHIISDGVSYGILYGELSALYPAFARGDSSPLPDLPVQFADVATWERERLRDQRLESLLEYWRRKLGGELPLLDVPTDRARGEAASHAGALHRFRIADPLFRAVREFCRREDATPFVTLLAAYAALLSGYARQDDILVGTPSSGRDRVELEGLIGFFIRTVIIRNDLSGNPTFRELLLRTRTTALEALAHQELPFERLVAAVRPPRVSGRPLLIRAWFCHMKGLIPALRLPGMTSSYEVADTKLSRFELSLILDESEDGIAGWFEYDTGLFMPSTVTEMEGRYQTLLRQAVEYPDTTLEALRAVTFQQESRARPAHGLAPPVAGPSKPGSIKRRPIRAGKTG